MNVQKAFTVNGSSGDSFSAADIPESEPEESGNQNDRNAAGKRSAGSATTFLNNWKIRFSSK
jgi:hypothetical protein